MFDFVYKFLSGGLNFTKKEYREYYQNLITLTDQKRLEVSTKLLNLRGVLKKVKQEANKRSLKIVNYDTESIIWKANNSKIEELTNEQTKLADEIEKLEGQLRQPETDRLTIEQFLNLSKNAANIIKSADVVGKDQIVREIFLNLEVDEAKVASYRLNPPFDTMRNTRDFSSSRGDWIWTSDLLVPNEARYHCATPRYLLILLFNIYT